MLGNNICLLGLGQQIQAGLGVPQLRLLFKKPLGGLLGRDHVHVRIGLVVGVDQVELLMTHGLLGIAGGLLVLLGHLGVWSCRGIVVEQPATHYALVDGG